MSRASPYLPFLSKGTSVIANEDSPYYEVGLLYCEGRNDETKNYTINSILFAKEFATECELNDPIDMEAYLPYFYEQYLATYVLFNEIVGSQA